MVVRCWGLMLAAALLAFVGSASRADASPEKACKRQCAVHMRGPCRKAIRTTVRACMDACKPLFDQHTHKCKVAGTCGEFTNFSQCRTSCTKSGSQESRTKCGKDARKTCQSCCAEGGTTETCVPSPSGAFLDE